MRKFTDTQELRTTSICDSGCVFKAKVLYRTPKTVVIAQYTSRDVVKGSFGILYEDENGKEEFRDWEENKRCKIHVDSEGNEFIYPNGRHSMAAKFRA